MDLTFGLPSYRLLNDCLVNQGGTREDKQVCNAETAKMIVVTKVLHLESSTNPHWRHEAVMSEWPQQQPDE